MKLKLDRLLDNYEFKLLNKEPISYRHPLQNAEGDVYLKIETLAVGFKSYDNAYKVGRYTHVNCFHPETNDHCHVETYVKGMFANFEEFDLLMEKYNNSPKKQREVFQEIKKLGEKYKIKVVNETAYKGSELVNLNNFMLKNKEMVSSLLHNKKLNQKIKDYQEVKSSFFNFVITMKNNKKLIIRVSSQFCDKECFPFLQEKMSHEFDKMKNAYGHSNVIFYFYNPNKMEFYQRPKDALDKINAIFEENLK